MPITVGNGQLLSMHVQFDAGVIDATVAYVLSNNSVQRIAHNNIPISSVRSYALAHGRSDFIPQDVCDVIAANNADFAPNTITPKA